MDINCDVIIIILKNIFILRRPRVADIMKIVTIFIKTIFKDLLKTIRN